MASRESISITLLFLLALAAITNGSKEGNQPKAAGAGDQKEESLHGSLGPGKTRGVTYDARSLIIDGTRELLFSGSIHYTRSTPEMWPDLLEKARRGGLNVIQTYVFWNVHEPVQGKFNFEGNYDLVKFVKLVQEKGMWLTLRVGPFIQAEWNHGGLPYWLREVPGIIFRSDNAPFKQHMQKYATMIIDKMKAEKLFAPQGGPIILSQIENEYNHVQLAYRTGGNNYVQWAANMAVSLQTGVPWIMCKQKDAPDPVINTCNGRHCGDTFTGPNKPNKPSLWTENWTAQYRVFGDPPSQRSAEDIAFSVIRFFSKSGSLTNYYMYHGGTNFGRTSSAFTTTRYYDEAPLDEYGLLREPKWSHLKDTHKALALCKRPLLWGSPRVEVLDKESEARIWEKAGTDLCAAFLSNNDSKIEKTVTFRGKKYYLPPHSISVLPDCKTIVFNTQTIVAQHNSRDFVKSKVVGNLKWRMAPEQIPTSQELKPNSKIPLELYSLLKDKTDYAWYTTTIALGHKDLPFRPDILPVLRVTSLGHAMHAFINGEYVGGAHGSHEEKSFVFQKPVKFNAGPNHITLLAMTVGLPDSGAYMEHRFSGPRMVTILGLNTGTLDLTQNGWGHKVGLHGETVRAFTPEGAKLMKWTDIKKPAMAAAWYESTFNAAEGTDPVAIRMTGMGKGQVWVNGNSIGRHWISYLSPLGHPSQSEYHIPRSFMKPKDNQLVIFEEEKATPDQVEIVTVNRDIICSIITEYHPPPVSTWERKDKQFRPVSDVKRAAPLKCPHNKKIVAIDFASFGDPIGACGTFSAGQCDLPAKEIAEQQCKGKVRCMIPMDAFDQTKNQCPGVSKFLAIQARCA